MPQKVRFGGAAARADFLLSLCFDPPVLHYEEGSASAPWTSPENAHIP
jgi:hypothetical protein